MKISHILACLLIYSGVFAKSKSNEWNLQSPDSKIKITLTLNSVQDATGTLSYLVVKKNRGVESQVLDSSPLGIERDDEQFVQKLRFISADKVVAISDAYQLKAGRQNQYKNNANEQTFTFRNETGSLIQLIFRAYNNGIAFRYVFPEVSDKKPIVRHEHTGFKIPENAALWLQQYDKATSYSPAYERYYENGIPAGTKSANDEGWAFPLLAKTVRNWLLIAESDLKPDYCGIHLEPNAANNLYKVRFPEQAEANGLGKVFPQISLPWVSPWRCITITENCEQLVSSHLVNDLATKPVSGDFSWVKPGRASWSWLSDNPSTKIYSKLKEFIDFSADMGWEYSLIDANWDLMEGGNMEQLIEYAHTKNVGIFMWYNSGGAHNDITERPRDIICNADARKSEFARLEKLGVKGIKVDFWGSDKQFMIKLYHEVLVDAAQYHLMVNLHGCTIPRGWSRTFPNLITYESVKGAENYLFDASYTQNAPIQNSILAFTRNVIGPMDYTPVTFSDFNNPHMSTNAHELALSLIFNSGVVHFADNQSVYRLQPTFVKDFLKLVPVTFDETRCLQGSPGKDVIIAARKGEKWFLAGINSESAIKTFKLSLNFMTKTKYQVSIITDKSPREFIHTESEIRSGKKMNLQTLPYGGFVMTLTPVK